MEKRQPSASRRGSLPMPRSRQPSGTSEGVFSLCVCITCSVSLILNQGMSLLQSIQGVSRGRPLPRDRMASILMDPSGYMLPSSFCGESQPGFWRNLERPPRLYLTQAHSPQVAIQRFEAMPMLLELQLPTLHILGSERLLCMCPCAQKIQSFAL